VLRETANAPRAESQFIQTISKSLLSVSAFYEQVLGAEVLREDEEHRVLQAPDVQIIIHAIPEQYSSSIVIEVPPVAREEQGACVGTQVVGRGRVNTFTSLRCDLVGKRPHYSGSHQAGR